MKTGFHRRRSSHRTTTLAGEGITETWLSIPWIHASYCQPQILFASGFERLNHWASRNVLLLIVTTSGADDLIAYLRLPASRSYHRWGSYVPYPIFGGLIEALDNLDMVDPKLLLRIRWINAWLQWSWLYWLVAQTASSSIWIRFRDEFPTIFGEYSLEALRLWALGCRSSRHATLEAIAPHRLSGVWRSRLDSTASPVIASADLRGPNQCSGNCSQHPAPVGPGAQDRQY